MEFALIDKWDPFPDVVGIYEQLDDLVNWKKIPPFHRPGRTGWLKLDQPVTINCRGWKTTIRSLKLKGIGLCDNKFGVSPPTSKYFNRKFPHLGFSRSGEFCLVQSERAPLGGIEFSRAETEYRIAKQLTEAGCPSITPVRLYKYSQEYSDVNAKSTLGTVITGLPNDHPFRIDCAYHYDAGSGMENLPRDYQNLGNRQSEEERAYVDQLICSLNFQNKNNPGLTLLSYFWEKYGHTLRRFHLSGFYRYSGALDNHGYCRETDNVFLIDLDSCRELSECSDVEKPLQIIRDIASAIFNLASSLSNPWQIARFPLDEIKHVKPFHSILKGYYQEAPYELIEGVIDLFFWYFGPLYEKTLLSYRGIIGEKDSLKQISKWKPLWMDRKIAYSILMVGLWFLHEKSTMKDQYPNRLCWKKLIENVSDFTSPEIAADIDKKVRALLVLV